MEELLAHVAARKVPELCRRRHRTTILWLERTKGKRARGRVQVGPEATGDALPGQAEVLHVP